MRSFQSRTLVFGGCLVIVGSYGIWRATHSAIGEGAKSCLAATIAGDADGIYRYSAAEEIRHLGLTQEKTRTLVRELVEPRIRMASPIGSLQLEVADDRSEASAVQTMRGSSGRVFEVSVRMYSTADGPKTSAFFNSLVRAWQIEYHSTRTGGGRASDMFTACRIGFAKDRATLERHGIHGFYSASRIPGMDRFFRTFEEYDAHWAKMEIVAAK